MQIQTQSPFALSNIKRFIAFRAFFNCRFYYPVFTILFLDYGLTIEQFALLNTVWAITIVLAEVPSGALADIIGRKRLLVTTACLMICEMLLLAFVPLGDSRLIFTIFCINRIISGLAEALASGADEAIAYDTLVTHGCEDDWPKVLDIQMRSRNFFYIITMTTGALLYDPGSINTILHCFGLNSTLSQQVTMRFPIYLTLLLGFFSLLVTLGMEDPVPIPGKSSHTPWQRISAVTKSTLQVGHWLICTPTALGIILFTMCLDHTLRMLVTLNSQYYRVIGLPEASFGLIGSGIALLGLLIPRIARSMTEQFTMQTNIIAVILLAFFSLWGLTFFTPYYGVLPMALIFICMMFTSFFASTYLNKLADSKYRATVLSYKGLAYNAAYGLIGLFYGGLVQELKNTSLSPSITAENEIFKQSITYFPGYLLAALCLIACFCFFHSRFTQQTCP